MTNDRRARSARAEQQRAEQARAAKRRRDLVTVAIVATVVVLVAAVGWGIKALSDANPGKAVVVAPPGLVDGPHGGFEHPATTAASDEAPVVEVYADFLCPHCAEFESSAGESLQAQADAGDIVLRFVPMTIMDGREAEGPAHDVMNAAVCAAEDPDPRAFWTMHDALFAQGYHEGGDPSAADLVAVADEAGVAALEECIESGRYVPWLDRIREPANERGVTGTPSVYVDDEKVDDVTAASVQKAIDAARS